MPPQKRDAIDVFNMGAASMVPNVGGSNAFNVLRYPNDLATINHPHYVMFFVNVRNTDLSESEQKSKTASVYIDNSDMNRTNTEGKNLGVMGGVVGGVGGGLAGGAGDKIVAEIKGGKPTNILRATGAVLGAAGGFAVGVSMDRTQVLLKDVIALYLSGKPSAHYTASWADEELGLAGAMGDKTNTWSGLSDILATTGSAASAAMLKGAEGLNSKVFGNIGKTFESTAAMTPNPFKAQLFKNMKFRQFSFDHIFLPRDESEYRQVKQIIYTFKKYMHPILGAGKFIMKYPAEFSIAYFYKNAVNPELFRISNCALTDLKVEYGGSDFTTFRETSKLKGAPTEISMKMQFTELEMLSQERIDSGLGF